MELDLSTFLLEILNFLVLVWLLKRFFYQPVLRVVEQRRAHIESTLAKAQATEHDAEALQKEYDGRLQQWAREREAALADLDQEISKERAAKLADLEQQLDRARARERAAAAKREADLRYKAEIDALDNAASFAGRLLRGLGSPDLEAHLIDLMIDELDQLPDARKQAIAKARTEGAAPVVATAYPLDADRRDRLMRTLSGWIPRSESTTFEQDESLIAGAEIRVGAWLLGFNLRDELAGFARLHDDDGG